jgi:hypothetical protein
LDDDFGLSDEQGTKPDLDSAKKQESSSIKPAACEDSDSSKQQPRKSPIKPIEISFAEKSETNLNEESFADEEFVKFTKSTEDTHLNQEELDYDDLLDYGEEDDLDMIQVSKEKIETKATDVVTAPKTKEVESLISKDGIENKLQEDKTSSADEAQTKAKQFESDKESKKESSREHKAQEEDDLENEEEDENGDMNSKRGRSNHWSERNTKNDKECNDKVPAKIILTNKC